MTAASPSPAAPEPLVVAFGELLWDLLPSGKVLGGAPANFAYRLHSLGDPVNLVSRLGEDALGNEARTQLTASGLSLDYVQADSKHPTGTVPVTLDAAGHPDFTITPNVAYDYLERTPELEELAARTSLACFGTLIQRSRTARETLYGFLERLPRDEMDGRPAATRLLDINLRKDCWSEETVLGSLARADILKLNDTEVSVVAELLSLPGEFHAFAAALFDRCPLSLCLVTRGAEGVLGFSRAGEAVQVPGKKVEVVDTIGAGDAFTAGFVHQYLRGASLEHCCAFGNAVGAAVAGVAGGMSPVTVSPG